MWEAFCLFLLLKVSCPAASRSEDVCFNLKLKGIHQLKMMNRFSDWPFRVYNWTMGFPQTHELYVMVSSHRLQWFVCQTKSRYYKEE